MRFFATILLIIYSILGFTQEIKRISKAGENIATKNMNYMRAIDSNLNTANETAYKGKDTLIFKKELSDFFEGLEVSLQSNDGSHNYNQKSMDYIIFISNTGYIDAFYYEFEDGKLKIPFMGTLNSFIANYKWPTTSHQKFTHKGIYTFKK